METPDCERTSVGILSPFNALIVFHAIKSRNCISSGLRWIRGCCWCAVCQILIVLPMLSAITRISAVREIVPLEGERGGGESFIPPPHPSYCGSLVHLVGSSALLAHSLEHVRAALTSPLRRWTRNGEWNNDRPKIMNKSYLGGNKFMNDCTARRDSLGHRMCKSCGQQVAGDHEHDTHSSPTPQKVH